MITRVRCHAFRIGLRSSFPIHFYGTEIDQPTYTSIRSLTCKAIGCENIHAPILLKRIRRPVVCHVCPRGKMNHALNIHERRLPLCMWSQFAYGDGIDFLGERHRSGSSADRSADSPTLLDKFVTECSSYKTCG